MIIEPVVFLDASVHLGGGSGGRGTLSPFLEVEEPDSADSTMPKARILIYQYTLCQIQ